MSSQMDLFFRTVHAIQDEVINIALTKKEKYDNTEELIADVSYEMTYKICELIDGLYDKNVKYRLTEINSNEVINNDAYFHDLCEDYLKCSDK